MLLYKKLLLMTFGTTYVLRYFHPCRVTAVYQPRTILLKDEKGEEG